VSTFRAGDPFYDQTQVVEAATTDIVAIRKQYQDGGYTDIPDVGEMNRTIGQHGPGNVAGHSLPNSFAGLNIAAAPPSIASHRKASKLNNHRLTEDRPRNLAKVSRRGRHHRNRSTQGCKISYGNVHKDADKFSHPPPNHPVSQNSCGFGGPARQAFNMATQAHNMPGAPVLQPRFYYNSFGAAIPGFIPQNASNIAAQGPVLPNTQMHQFGNHFNTQHTSHMAAQGPAQPTIQMHQYGNHFNTQHAPNIAAHNFALPVAQTSQSVVPFNPQPVGWNAAAQLTSQLTTRGPTLPAVPVFQPGFSFNPQVAAQNASVAYHPLMAAQYATAAPDPSYYGPCIEMSVSHQDWIMAANGIKLPATYIPDPRCYNGPLHFLATPVAHAIMAAAEASQNPAYPFYRPRAQLAQMTMLQPYGLPPQCYIPGTSQRDIHLTECARHIELMQEVLAVPGNTKLNEEPMRWFRLLGEPKLRRGPVAWHPDVIDLYGRESQYEQLLVRDVNHRNDNEKGVGRKNAPVNWQTQAGATMRVDTVSQKSVHHAANGEVGEGSHKAPTMTHARQECEQNSVFFKDQRTPPPSHNQHQYVGYRMRVKRHEEPSPEISPTPPSRRRSTQLNAGKTPLNFNRSQSATHGQKRAIPTTTPLNPERRSSGDHEVEGESTASKTPLLDFDSRYTAKHGEEDVDFAVRDMGPPRIGGKTFNEAIGFTPSPKKAVESPASLFYPVGVWRKHRD
jgi:hypothetical protein